MSKAITTEHLEWYSRPDLTDELIAGASTPRDKAFISTLAKTGMRISEAVQLKESDISE